MVLIQILLFQYFRTVASTNMNDVSSRSHAIFTILFTQVSFSSESMVESWSQHQACQSWVWVLISDQLLDVHGFSAAWNKILNEQQLSWSDINLGFYRKPEFQLIALCSWATTFSLPVAIACLTVFAKWLSYKMNCLDPFSSSILCKFQYTHYQKESLIWCVLVLDK